MHGTGTDPDSSIISGIVIDQEASLTVAAWQDRWRGLYVCLTILIFEGVIVGGLLFSSSMARTGGIVAWGAFAVSLPFVSLAVFLHPWRSVRSKARATTPDAEIVVLASAAYSIIRAEAKAMLGSDALGRSWLALYDDRIDIWRAHDEKLVASYPPGDVRLVTQLNVWRSILTAPMIRVRFSDGRVLDGTPVHGSLRDLIGHNRAAVARIGANIAARYGERP